MRGITKNKKVILVVLVVVITVTFQIILGETAMTMTTHLRKFALTVHLTSSVGWIGAVVAFLALVVAAMTSQDEQTLRAAWIAMELTGWYAIAPYGWRKQREQRTMRQPVDTKT